MKGLMVEYLAECDRENRHDARRRAERKAAESDPALQCVHGVSLFRPCSLPGCAEGDAS